MENKVMNDEVFQFINFGRIRFGSVVQTDDCNYSDTTCSSLTHVQNGEIRVLWNPTCYESVIPANMLGLANRSFEPGDLVQKITEGVESRRGICINVNISPSIKLLGTEYILPAVDKERLELVDRFSNKVIVILDTWIGVSRDAKCSLRIITKDGSKCEFPDAYTCLLEPVEPHMESRFCRHSFYPGQIVCGGMGQLDAAKWLCCTNEMQALRKQKEKREKFLVEEVVLKSVNVHWLGQMSKSGASPKDILPKKLIEGEDLKKVKLLNTIVYPQLGDRFFMNIVENDQPLLSKEWGKKQLEKYAPVWRQLKNRRKQKKCSTAAKRRLSQPQPKAGNTRDSNLEQSNKAERPNSEMNQNDEPDISTQASKIANNLRMTDENNSGDRQFDEEEDWQSLSDDSDSMIRCSKLSEKSRTKKRREIRRKRNLAKNVQSKPFPKPGERVVVETIQTATTVDVLWQDGTFEADIPAINLELIKLLDTEEFFSGNLVMKDSTNKPSSAEYGVVQKIDYAGRTGVVRWFKVPSQPNLIESELMSEQEVSCYELKDHRDYPVRYGCIVLNLPEENRVGQVIEMKTSGTIKVRWLEDGAESECYPQQIRRIRGESDLDDDSFWFTSESDGSWETETSSGIIHEIEVHLIECSVESPMSSYQGPSNNPVPEIPILVEKVAFVQIEEIDLASKKLLPLFVNETQSLTPALIEELVRTAGNCKAVFDTVLNLDFFGSVTFMHLLTKIDKERKSMTMFSTGEFDTSVQQTSDVLHACRELCTIMRSQVAKAIAHINRHQPLVMCMWLNNLMAANTGDCASPRTLPFYFSTRENRTVVVESTDPAKKEALREKFAHKETNELNADAVTEPATQVEVHLPDNNGGQSYGMLEKVPLQHKFVAAPISTSSLQMSAYYKAVARDHKLLTTDLPPGVWIRYFADRSDLYSIMIAGPKDTPYESALFLFDVKLTNYPLSPPLFHYISYCTDRLNPNLYEDGKVCVSLLGTWTGSGYELWGKDSNLLQVILSIQGLILNDAPYFNEAGYETYRSANKGGKTSRLYNEMVLLKIIQSMAKMITSPYSVFQQEIKKFMSENVTDFINRMEAWIYPENQDENHPEIAPPKFPLLPISKGLKISAKPALENLKNVLQKENVLCNNL